MLQIASMSPLFVRREDVPAAQQDKQREIFQAQMDEEAKQTGKAKPAAVTAKILDGKIDKWLQESLSGRAGLGRGRREDHPAARGRTDRENRREDRVRRFVRYELGEGIEKQKTDLAAEVAATISGT